MEDFPSSANLKDAPAVEDLLRQRDEALRRHRDAEERLALLAEASRALLPPASGASVVPAVLGLSQQLIRADAYAVWRCDPASGSWEIVAQAGLSDDYPRTIPPAWISMPIAPILVPDVEAEPLLVQRQGAYQSEGIRSIACLPMRVHGENCATITFYYRTPRRLDELEIRVATALADLAASAITTAELHAEQGRMRAQAEEAQQWMAFLAEAGAILASSLDYETTLQQVARLAVPRLADWCTVDVLEADGALKSLVVMHSDPAKVEWARELQRRYPPDPNAAGGVPQVIRTGRLEIHPEITDEMLVQVAPDEERLEILRAIGFASILIVPLTARGRTFGALSWIAAESGRHYGPEDLALAEALAQRAAFAVDNARLYREAQDEIARREPVEAALRASEERFRATYEQAAIGIGQVALDGRLLDVNPKLCEMLGYRREELLQRTFARITHAEDLVEEERYLARLLAGAIPSYRLEKRYLRKDGTPIWVRVTSSLAGPPGRATYRISIIEDISERKQAEAALAESEERLAGIIASAMDAILTIDAGQRILLFNTAAERMFRCPAAEAIGSPIDRFIPPRFHEAHRRHIRSFGATGVTSRSMRTPGTLLACRADGAEFPIEATISQIEVAGQKLYTVIVRDVTERARLELELRRRVHELAEADRQKDAFLVMLGHELRTPMGVIRNTLALVERRTRGHADLDRLRERIERQVGRMAHLIDDLQDISRISRGKVQLHRKELDLTRLLREIAEDQRSTFEEAGLTFVPELLDAAVLVEADPTRLAQVVVNLLNNAAKFTDAGGRVALRLTRDDRWATVTVRDTGIGIEAPMLPHVFRSFAQEEHDLARTRGGLGLGLALVKGLVELHGGGVDVASPGRGQGTEATFRLPLAGGASRLPGTGSGGSEYDRIEATHRLHPPTPLDEER